MLPGSLAQRTLPPKDPKAVFEKFREVAVTGNEIEEASNEPVDWVWRPYVASGSICLVAGNTTGGKTSFIFLLLAARTSKQPIDFLGHALTPAPVDQYIVVIEPEHSRGSSARKFKKSARLQGLDPKDVFKRLLIVAGSSSLMVGDARWRQLCELIAAGMVSDVLLDTIASTTTEEGGDEQAQAALFTKLRLAIESAPANRPPPVIWPLAHIRKGKGEEEEVDVAAVSGSLQRAAQSNTVLLIRSNRQKYKIVSATVFFIKTKEEPLEGFSDTDLNPKTYEVTSSRFQLFGNKKPDQPLPDRVLELLKNNPVGLTANAISTLLKRSFKDVKVALENLVSEKKVRHPDEDPDVSSEGGLFFIVSQMKSITKKTTPTKVDQKVKKGTPTTPPTTPRRKGVSSAQVIDIKKFRRHPDEK